MFSVKEDEREQKNEVTAYVFVEIYCITKYMSLGLFINCLMFAFYKFLMPEFALPAIIGPIDNHTIAIMDVVCGNLLQITFLSDQLGPSLYTYTILSKPVI